MKMVLNKCYGGYGLSYEAVMEYAKIKGIKLYAYEVRNLRGKEELTPIRNQDDVKNYYAIHYSKASITDDDFLALMDSGFDPHKIERDDPALIEVVEKLGAAASGPASKLVVVELPDPKYEIVDFDGMEKVEFLNRTWS